MGRCGRQEGLVAMKVHVELGAAQVLRVVRGEVRAG